MPHIIVAHSTVNDGSMLNRENARDGQVLIHREQWLAPLAIDIHNTYRICLTFENNGNYCRYREVTPDDASAAEYDVDNEQADALITTHIGQALFLPLADCIGAVLFDERQGVLMLSHLGRHSLEQDGGVHSVDYLMTHYGSRPEELKVWLSAAVGKDTYKIFAMHNQGLKEVLFGQLERAGVRYENITDTPYDTAIDPRYYSHSEFLKANKPDNGRHAMVAMMTHDRA